MINRKPFLTTLISSILLTGCTSGEPGKHQEVAKNDTPKIQTIISKKTNYELLQGKWQSEDDSTNFLVFDKNIRKETALGMEGWDEEEFILTDHCLNEANISDNDEKEKDSYISCKKSDLCWYIMSLTEKRLTLQYMGRGNTLIYTRVKD